MNSRIQRLREQSLSSKPILSTERAELLTRFYRDNIDKYPTPILRALSFKYLCEHKVIYIGEEELIVGERGPEPKATPTYPELTCHSIEDLRILNSRSRTDYGVSIESISIYENEIIPFWRGRSLRDQIFNELPRDWVLSYEAGIFTEFMEQRAPGHTVADGKIYLKGMNDFKADIKEVLEKLHFIEDPLALQKKVQLQAMIIAADAVILFARRHADLAQRLAEREIDPHRKQELEKIRETCLRVPAAPPRDFWEALQMYWFCHLAVITELNGWDSFCPGHLDQHLEPFYQNGLHDEVISREEAKELLQSFFIKFNNHPAPPKVGVTAAESGTYTDFTNINLAGLRKDGSSGVGEVSYLLLEVIDELHILQPGQNVQISGETQTEFLHEACRVIRKGYGFPSVFNADMIVKELIRQGKEVEDAREGGASGCVEAGAFGKEAYILTGYLNLPKILEVTLHDGLDPGTGIQLGPETGAPEDFKTFQDLFQAWEMQLHHFIDVKMRGNLLIERIYAERMPAPFLSLITDDCIKKGMDYNEGGARYNTSYIQGVGIGTLTDSFAAIKWIVYDKRILTLADLLTATDADFEGKEELRRLLRNKSPKWGNDDDSADEIMRAAFDAFFAAVDGRPNLRGGTYHINMLPTTCHIYFGSVTGATPDGRRAAEALSEGISPVQGMDRHGPTAVLLSAAKMEHVRTGGTLLNMKFLPHVLEGEDGLKKLAALIRTYFRLGGHHIQFNVVDEKILRQAQVSPEEYRDLIVRVAGYSDYFCDLSESLQDEIISRTAQSAH
ncbi:MAG: glycyl radical protein [Candidatus Eisenbacteria bacterium]|uniref:Glycyl radical protein n=1 Tax=Eiseniibacteriota bacterium TaxID=2212470 RepID=A0A948RT18_UNCEI|nr:glycyl radical protein [Candidatus Eisenbacteria bacterium]MBU1948732.1 glycyl radical protein [Candidatus Eisenbacteria bacterium]MBU2690483.1 glycyl radical protein [Candidatus Eisenbacteria bacterium]